MKWIKYGLCGILGAIALAAVVLLALGQRADAGRSKMTIEIDRPPAVVWAWLEEADKFKQWVSWVTEVRDSGPSGRGGKRTVIMKDPNMNGAPVEMNSVLTEYTPHKRMAVNLESPIGFRGVMTYDLTDLGNGRTRLTADGVFQYDHWFAKLMEPLVTPQATAKGEADFAMLKKLAEKDAR